MFKILFENELMIAINKPSGWAVHKSKMVNAEKFVLQVLRDQIGQFIYPVHRLDVGTSGVLLFAKNPQAAEFISAQFRENTVVKEYRALCRGWLLEERVSCDKPLAKANKKEERAASTLFSVIQQYEILHPVGKFSTARVQWLEAFPKTGIYHQIRRHANRLAIPIIGDRMHGDNRYNHFFKEAFGNGRLLLHCSKMSLKVERDTTVEFVADLPDEMKDVLIQLEKFQIKKPT